MRTSPLWTVAAADRVHHEPVPARAHEKAATDGDVPIRVADSGPVRGQPRRVVEKGPGKEAWCVRLRDGPRVPLRLRALDLAGGGLDPGRDHDPAGHRRGGPPRHRPSLAAP